MAYSPDDDLVVDPQQFPTDFSSWAAAQAAAPSVYAYSTLPIGAPAPAQDLPAPQQDAPAPAPAQQDAPAPAPAPDAAPAPVPQPAAATSSAPAASDAPVAAPAPVQVAANTAVAPKPADTATTPAPSSASDDRYASASPPPNSAMQNIVQASAKKYGVPITVANWVGSHESDWKTDAVGPETSTGTAKGAWQLKDDTAKRLGVDPNDFQSSTDGAMKELRRLYDETGDWPTAVKKYGTFSTGKPEQDAQAEAGFRSYMGMPVSSTTKTAAGGLPSGVFPSAASIYGPIQQSISDYIKGQPAMWDKLAQMQQQYLQSSKPTLQDRVNDFSNSMAQSQIATAGLRHTSAGSIVYNQVPNMDNPLKAAMNTQQQENLAKQQRLQTAQTAYQMGSSNIQAQQQQAFQNLGLTTTVAKDMANYNFETTKTLLDYGQKQLEMQVKLKQLGNTQATALSDSLEKQVPNATTRAAIWTEFIGAGNDPSASLPQNMTKLSAIIQKHTAAGENLNAAAAPHIYELVRPNDNNADGAPDRDSADASTPEGRAKIDSAVKAGWVARDLSAPQNNIGLPAAGGGGGGTGDASGGGGAAAMGYAQQRRTSTETKSASDALLALMPYIRAHGDSGILTDSEEGKTVANMIYQVTGGRVNPVGNEVRTLFDKLASQVQTGLTLPQLKQFGSRPAQTEFQQLLKGSLGPGANSTALEEFLKHTSAVANWETQRVDNLVQSRQVARRHNNTFWDPDDAEIRWEMGRDINGNLTETPHPAPVWDADSILTAAEKQRQSLIAKNTGGVTGAANRAANRAGTPLVAPTAKTATGETIPGSLATIGGKTYVFDGKNWNPQDQHTYDWVSPQ